MNSSKKKTTSINIRLKIAQRDLIDKAAESLGRSRSDFMLEEACRKAEEVLLDPLFFTVNKQIFKQFQTLLDRPLPVSERLKRLLKTKASWEN